MPSKHEYPELKFDQYIHLGSNYGFILYTRKSEAGVSMISFNSNKTIYKLIGNSYNIYQNLTENIRSNVSEIYILPKNVFCIMIYGSSNYKLHFFKLNRLEKKFEFMKEISIPRKVKWIGMVNEKIVSAVHKVSPQNVLDNFYTIDYVTFINEDGSFTKLENSAIVFRKNYSFISAGVERVSFQIYII